MKERSSVTVSKEVLAGIDRSARSKQSRTALIETVLAQYLRSGAPAQVEARELDLINKAADELTEEVEDVLRYQIGIGSSAKIGVELAHSHSRRGFTTL